MKAAQQGERRAYRLRIWRQAGPHQTGRLVDYDIDGVDPGVSFLEMLDQLNEDLTKRGEDVIAFDSDCREGICGACGVCIDGRPHGPVVNITTCTLRMREFPNGATITVEPFRSAAFPVVKDLVVDRSAFFVASAIFLAGGAAIALRLLPLPEPVRVGLIATAVAAPALAVAFYGLLRHGGVARPLARVAGLFARRRAPALLAGAREIDEIVRSLHRGRKRRFAGAFLIHLVGRTVSAVEALVAARLLGIPLDVPGAVVLTAVPLALDMVLGILPSQIGFHEGAITVLVAAMRYDPAAGVALALALRLRQIVFVAVGFAVLVVRRRRRPRPEPERLVPATSE